MVIFSLLLLSFSISTAVTAHNDLNSNLLLLRSGLSNPLFPVLQDFFLQLARLKLFDMHTCMRRNRSHISPRATIILRSSFTSIAP
uniref:Secreted protein n=1 Tax=Trichogramma kaykai TaxID=54128 RepID=A0ABD2X0G2_9HYME